MTFKTQTRSAADWDCLDAELARWLRTRTALRAERERDASSLDGVALALRRVRGALTFAACSVTAGDDEEAVVSALVSRTYRWSIRVARELEAIEQLGLDPIAEWGRFEAFAPFALAFFDSVLASPFEAATKTAEVARLRREIDAVLAPLTTAMTSSALAA
jgi:hypothetical protein